jgi:hypothetical protein
MPPRVNKRCTSTATAQSQFPAFLYARTIVNFPLMRKVIPRLRCRAEFGERVFRYGWHNVRFKAALDATGFEQK